MYDLSKYQRMMVCLDLTEMDGIIIKYASMIANTFGIDAVYFIHVADSLELPEEIRHKYPDLAVPVDETLEKEIDFAVKENFTAPENCSVHINVLTGNVTEEVLKASKVKVADLLLVGRKEKLTGSGLNSKKISKSSIASVIFVPEEARTELNRILVSIDYSDHAKMAFEIGIDIQKKTGAKLLSNNVYLVPTGYHKSGKSYDEFAEIMLENTKTDCKKFFKKIDLEGVDYDHTYALDDDPHPADKIYRTATEVDADMIILGSKGRTSIASFLVGSVAEKLIMETHNIPLFIVKKGGENLSFLEALFKM